MEILWNCFLFLATVTIVVSCFVALTYGWEKECSSLGCLLVEKYESFTTESTWSSSAQKQQAGTARLHSRH